MPQLATRPIEELLAIVQLLYDYFYLTKEKILRTAIIKTVNIKMKT